MQYYNDDYSGTPASTTVLFALAGGSLCAEDAGDDDGDQADSVGIVCTMNDP